VTEVLQNLVTVVHLMCYFQIIIASSSSALTAYIRVAIIQYIPTTAIHTLDVTASVYLKLKAVITQKNPNKIKGIEYKNIKFTTCLIIFIIVYLE
jgi:hypothetical protein